MKKITGFCFLIFSIAMSVPLYAEPAWYIGKVSRVALLPGGFLITMDTLALDDCYAKYAYFYESSLGQERVMLGYSMALESLSSNLKMGVVIDKAAKGSVGQCYVTGMIDLRPG